MENQPTSNLCRAYKERSVSPRLVYDLLHIVRVKLVRLLSLYHALLHLVDQLPICGLQIVCPAEIGADVDEQRGQIPLVKAVLGALVVPRIAVRTTETL